MTSAVGAFLAMKAIKVENENSRSVKLQKHPISCRSWNASQKEMAVFLEM